MIEQARQQISEGFSSFEPQLSEIRDRIGQRATNVQERIGQRASNVQLRIRKTQSRGVIGLFRAQEKAASTIHRTADRLPAQLPGNFRKELEAIGDKLLAPPVDEWKSYNAKTAIKAARELGLLDSLRIRRYESGTKNRKTVLRAIDSHISKHEEGVFS
jgi:hypothetical protein